MDGVCGICYEHTTSEGIAVVTMLQRILVKMEKEDEEEGASKRYISTLRLCCCHEY